MKMRTGILVAIAALLLTSSVALAQSSGLVPTLYAVEHGIASGGHYQLISLSVRDGRDETWQVSGTASSPRYRLLGPAASSSSENGCCCMYLPCVLRN